MDARDVVPPFVPLSDLVPNAPTAHRASGGADGATDMSSAGFGASGTEQTKGRQSIAVWVEFATAGASCIVTPVFYDNSAPPAPLALGAALSFTATGKRVSAAGNYMSAVQLIDAAGFQRFKLHRDSISAGNVTVFAQPL